MSTGVSKLLTFSVRAASALIAVVLTTGLCAVRAASDTTVVHFRSIAEGLTEASASSRPVLLFFTAAWCAPCHELQRRVFGVSVFAKFVEKTFVPIEVVDRRREDGSNSPEVQALLARWKVGGLPTLIVFRSNGRVAKRLAGFSTREATLTFLRIAAQDVQAGGVNQQPLAH